MMCETQRMQFSITSLHLNQMIIRHCLECAENWWGKEWLEEERDNTVSHLNLHPSSTTKYPRQCNELQ